MVTVGMVDDGACGVGTCIFWFALVWASHISTHIQKQSLHIQLRNAACVISDMKLDRFLWSYNN